MRRPEQQVEQFIDAVETDVRPGLDRGRLVVMTQDPAVQVRDGDVDARRAEVRDKDMAGTRPERQLARRPPASARANVALDDQAALDELADALGDDRPTEAGPVDELRPGSRPPEADFVEDCDERVEGLVRDRGAGGTVVGLAHDAIIRRFLCPSDDFCT
jgi:hypothetical protein